MNDRLERAAQLVVRSRIFFDIWFFLDQAETRSDTVDVIDTFYEFFRFDVHAHFVAFTIHMAALFETRTDTINLRSLFNEMKAENSVSSTDAAEINVLFSQATDAAKKVATLRNKLFAHRSATDSYEDAFNEANVTADELRDLSDVALRIVSRLLRANGLYAQCFNHLPVQDAEAILNALKKSGDRA
jgi:HEPN superfamily AbiU2-like protein